MKIEILYPEICTLYGDKGNTMYLQKCLPDAEFVTTGLNEKPLFLKENIDMVYMCSMSEKSQELVLDRLMQYKDEIAACMKDGKALFLLVGNSMELLVIISRERMEPELQDLALFRACTQSARLRIVSTRSSRRSSTI